MDQLALDQRNKTNYMPGLKSKIFNILRKKELLLFLILLIAVTGLTGWLSGKMILAAYSLNYVPIAPSNIVMISSLTVIFLFRKKFSNSYFGRLISTSLVVFILLFCLLIFIQYFFSLASDIERAFLKNPQRIGNILTGRMSPITSILFILTCLGILITNKINSARTTYFGGFVSLLSFSISSILLIGYLYKAPLLYGGKIIPVSLPTVICFFLLSLTLLGEYEYKYWTFSLIRENKTVWLLLKSFLPPVFLMIVLQGFLITNFPIAHNNPTLSVALILFIVIILTLYIVIKVSKVLGNNLYEAENALKESEEKFRSIMDHSADAVFITNNQGKYIYTNKAVTNLLGFSHKEMITMTFRDISPKDKVEDYITIFNQILNEGSAFYEIELLKKDGTFISTDLNAVLLPDGSTYASCRDITERKQIEQSLKDSDTKYRLIADYNYDWEFWLTNEKKFKYNSPSCERISGYKPDDFLTNPALFTKIIHHDDLNIYETHIDEINSPCMGVDYRIITPAGQVRWIHHVCQPIFDENENIIGRRGTNSDITIRKNAENKIKELNSAKDRFISILGHDLKSPFNVILGFSEALITDIETLTNEQIAEFAQFIYKSAKSTNSLLEDILMWAKSQQGKLSFNPKKLNLANVTNTILEIFNPGAYSKNLIINYSSGDLIEVYADIDMLKTIMLNLVSNAIKFTNKGGIINIKAEVYSEYTAIVISDDGVGISPEDISKLFDISQVHTTKGTDDESGTGLGLLLCKEFVERHGGKIWVESELNAGSQFSFTLPNPVPTL